MTRESDYQQHRGLVFTIAYDITGSVVDAEDVAQEVYLSWQAVTDEVTNPRAYLATAATHRALNTVRSARRRREEYLGPWLPEPLPTDVGGPPLASPEDTAVTADAISTAMLIVLQSLTEDERAAFILRDIFDFGYAEIAKAMGKSVPAARQLVHRARGQVQARRQRNSVSADHHQAVVHRFMEAVSTGNIQVLLSLLAPDVVLTSDGGGKVSAALRPISSPDKVARFLLGLVTKYGQDLRPELVELNGLVALAASGSAGLAATCQFEVENGLVQKIFVIVNPDKLARSSVLLAGRGDL